MALHERMRKSCAKILSRGLIGILAIIIVGCQSQIPQEIKMVFPSLPDQVDFNFHIRPILSDRCYKCHGPDDDAREAEFRLDLEERAFATLKESGGHAFVKRRPEKSIAWQRIISNDPEEQMPPPESNLSLSTKEKALITRWIEQGAKWKSHWAYIANVSPDIPQDLPPAWSQENVIDHFVQAAMVEQDLFPSPMAGKERIIRRLSFDLSGLPPSLSDVDKFVNDNSTDAYETLVDRLLSTDAHAERLAMEWMDVARYADSHGLHADGLRTMWPWRDWVIRAFKDNLSYDQFIRWQLAGDLIPNATTNQKLATGFLRNQPLNSELGIVNEEFRLKYVADRSNTTGTAFLGLTLECASCHDHKFDPISQREYYQMSSFFNNVHELGMIGNDRNFGPLLLLPSPETSAKIQELTHVINHLEERGNVRATEIKAAGNYLKTIQSQQIDLPQPQVRFPLDNLNIEAKEGRNPVYIIDQNRNSISTGEPELVEGQIGMAVCLDNDYETMYLEGIKNFDMHDPFSAGAWIKTEKSGTYQSIIGNIGDKNTGWRGWIFYLDSLNRAGMMLVHNLSHNYLHVVTDSSIDLDTWTNVYFTYDGSATGRGIKIYINGKQASQQVVFDRLYKNIRPVMHRNYTPEPGRKIRMGIGSKYLFSETDDGVFTGCLDHVQIYNEELTALEVASVYRSETDIDSHQVADQDDLLSHYLRRNDIESGRIREELTRLRQEKSSLLDSVEEVMVMEEMSSPRKTYILERGQYDSPGDEVFAQTPDAIMPFPSHLPKDRLGFAEWLLDDDHPLTARVTVNRYWQMIFGRGLVSTPHDFGVQGDLPSHPKLLDWLAKEFQETGWDLRKLLKSMVMSATYRQASEIDEVSSTDAKNIYLSRGPSYRMQMEMIRDNALAASGLLNDEIGGRSVKPYQPEGLWKEKNEFSGFLQRYEQDSGSDLYRRSLYTFIRRTSPPPIMTTFDVPSRDVCSVQRERTNTPLQALVLLNEPLFIEASRVLAERMQKERDELKARITFAFRQLCGRHPNGSELSALMEQYHFVKEKFEQDRLSAIALLEVGDHPVDRDLYLVETAALTMVANTIMNFDEAYMKR